MTVKKKMAAGAISVGLLSGLGLAFANTDAGEALKTWYGGMFNNAKAAIEQDVGQYAADQLPGLVDEYNGLKDEAAFNIDFTKDHESGRAAGAINEAKAAHLSSLGAAKAEILAGMDLAFHNMYLEGWQRIQDAGDEAIAYATTDLTAFTGQQGAAAMGELTDELNAVRDQAVSDLENAIENAKAEITAELDSQTETTAYNLKNAIDFEITDVRNQVTALLNNLVAAQEALIEAKALELENAAKAALDAVVSGINE